MRKRSVVDQPYVGNYPALDAWLKKLDARCDFQLPVGPSGARTAMVERWIPRGGTGFFVFVYAEHRGWDIFTSCALLDIEKTFADAEVRLGLKPAEVEDPVGDAVGSVMGRS